MTATAALYVLCAFAVFGAILIASIVQRARARHVTCPETGKMVEVACDPAQAIKASFLEADQRIVGCDRWKERGECEGECSGQLAPKL